MNYILDYLNDLLDSKKTELVLNGDYFQNKSNLFGNITHI